MRVIEPKARPVRKTGKRVKPLSQVIRLVVLIASLSLVGWGAYSFLFDRPTAKSTPVQDSIETDKEPTAKPAATKLKHFENDEFRQLYNTFAYPGTVELAEIPEITGHEEADKRIRELAEERGYLKRTVPSVPLLDVDGVRLQQKTAEPWRQLKAAAAEAGHRLVLVSGYRSLDEQRQLFIDRLSASPAAIAAGRADAAVNTTLLMTAIPGYSKHHTGYTIDIRCASHPAVLFVNSRCFAWLSRDNYAHAKKYGWIPSYPEGTGAQGPEPEAWEYVWVGRDATHE